MHVGYDTDSTPASGTDVSFTMPTVEDGDNVFLIIVADDSAIAYIQANQTAVGIPAASWTFLQSYNDGTGVGKPTVAVYYHSALATDSGDPVVVDWTANGASNLCIGALDVWRGITGTFTQVGTDKRQSWDLQSAGAGAKHSDRDLTVGPNAQPDQGFIYYISGVYAAFLASATVTAVPSEVEVEEAIPMFYQYAGGGSLQYFALTVYSRQLTAAAAGEPAVHFNIDYTDTVASSSRPFLAELAGLTGPAPTAPSPGSSPIELPPTRLTLKVLPNKLTSVLLDGFD